MSDDQDDLFRSKALRDAAIESVSENAGDWMNVAYANILQLQPGLEGTGEAIRLRLTEGGCPRPHHHNAWGALIRTAVKRGALRETGRMAHMTSDRSHARRTPVYRRAG